ncbi:choice-of-anchor I family protein [Chitiniphilus eburneus]|uniref:Alkaline phosphatase n=1 Tax=Chitiniphilus eburneus TaxID=2571148 RepID=A0A4U0Q5A5_9NEIS|nr:choice-of-anchor I family protein [Chitiniphilus eburneus]TJZ76255.1 alkaline phosphatase [Chitiniphilus eburneus]
MKTWIAAGSALALAGVLAACATDDSNPATPTPTPAPAPTPAPTPVPEVTPDSISLELLGRFSTGVFAQSAAEIPAFDPASKRGFIVNAKKGVIDVLDLTDPAQPVHIGELSAQAILAGAEINSVSLHDGIVAVAIQAPDKTAPGYAAFYRAADLAPLSHVQIGALPDMITFTPDGKTVLVANEAEPSPDYQIDPPGSISVIDVRDIAHPVVRTADFTAWDGKEAELRAKGVRIYGPNAKASQDLEPEYIAVSADSTTAWVTLQENNALAKVDIAQAKVIDILPLGFKDHGLAGNGLDVSDADGKIDIRTWPGLRGLYLPDAIAAYAVDGKTYLVTANEGDSRAWFSDETAYFAGDASKGFVEEFRVKHLVHKDGFDRRKNDDLPPQLRALAVGGTLNPAIFGYCGATATNPGNCTKDEQLGRLNVTWTMGYQTNADGTPKLNGAGKLVYDALYSFGGRSISIWDENGVQVWDSGDQLETKLAELNPTFFNSDHEKAAFDDRSDNKGPEPEGVTLGRIGTKTFAFIGLERVGGVMIYDITNPKAPFYVSYLNTRDFTAADPATPAAGDLGPEGLIFVPASKSPNGKPMLIVGNEVSGTTAIYQVVLQ